MPPPPAIKQSGVVVPNEPRWYQRLAGAAVYTFIRLIGFTLRYRWTDRTGPDASGPDGTAIFAGWHNRLFLVLPAYRRFVRLHSRPDRLAVMVSASKDGAFLTSVLECFRVQPARGSSSRRGAQALRELTSWARRGHNLGITPDGPRGPRYVVQDGAIALAQLTGLPVIPMACNFGWKIQIKSWDRFQIPLPFSRCEVVYGPPVRVPREATPDEREQFRLLLENGLKEISND